MKIAIVLLAIAGCASQPPVACTMEAKACPDGSYVGRDAAKNCQFKACP